MLVIRVKPGATIIELTEGRTMPHVARLQSSIVVEAVVHYDADGDHVFEFEYHSRRWTVGYEWVEVLS